MKYLSLLILALFLVACGSSPTEAPVLLATATSTPTPTQEIAAAPPIPAPQLTGFKMVDALNGWATSSENILRTRDGGETWYDITPPGLVSVQPSFSTYYFDRDHAWLIVPNSDFTAGKLVYTSDGGDSWSSAVIPFSGAMLQFFDFQVGIGLVALGAGAGSEAVALFSTENSGLDWTRLYINDPTVAGSSDTLPLSGQKTSLGFSDLSNGFVGGSVPMEDYFYLFQTGDGGITWTERSLPWPAERAGYFAEVEQIHFTSQQEGYLVASLVGDLQESYIYQTLDGGSAWTQLGGSISRSRSFTILPGPEIFCWDPENVVNFTLDGITWQQLTPNVDFGDDLRDMQFVDSGSGFVLSVDPDTGHASFYATHDGGAVWTTLIP